MTVEMLHEAPLQKQMITGFRQWVNSLSTAAILG
jgi:hypothetical protein